MRTLLNAGLTAPMAATAGAPQSSKNHSGLALRAETHLSFYRRALALVSR